MVLKSKKNSFMNILKKSLHMYFFLMNYFDSKLKNFSNLIPNLHPISINLCKKYMIDTYSFIPLFFSGSKYKEKINSKYV